MNAGSTGLASLALAAAGNSKEPAGCTGWLGRLQLPVTSTQAELRGAIAPSPADLAALVTTPVAYWTSGDNADRVRQATAQAILGLTATAVACRRPNGRTARTALTLVSASPRPRSVHGRAPTTRCR
ncbi:hypothetical protein [Fodinicola feengrottensis]|uniref:hypothetical protein n=1 Tax=Fodinicola feengrottensis TaxID=435914 RepID=UPI0013D817F3|nr:hypothetical protein [Fodinicola feengrottensis]